MMCARPSFACRSCSPCPFAILQYAMTRIRVAPLYARRRTSRVSWRSSQKQSNTPSIRRSNLRTTALVAMRTVRRRLTDGLGQPLCMVRIHPPAPVVSPTSLMSLARRGLRTYRARALLSARVATLDIWLHSLAQLLQQERSLQPHLHDRAVEAHSSGSGFFVGGFDFIQAALELDAFSVVGFFDAGSERRAGCALSGYYLNVN